MKFSKFSQLVTRLYELHQERSDYADRIPNDLHTVLDNEYQNKTEFMFEFLFDEVFGEYGEDVTTFLYSPFPQDIMVDLNDGAGMREYEINNLDDYLKYAQEVFNFDPE